MAVANDAAPEQPKQPEQRPNGRDRARRLYAHARLLEDLTTSERGKEIARDVALLALDMLAESRAEKAA